MAPTDQIIVWQDNLYVVKRRILEHHQPIIDAWKETLDCETVLRRDGYLWFCNRISDAEIIE